MQQITIGARALGTTVAAVMLVVGAADAVADESLKSVCADSAACAHVQIMEHDDLASVTGKFSLPVDVVGMNLNMLSSWLADNGQRLESKASLGLGLPASGNPVTQLGTSASVSDVGTLTSNAAASRLASAASGLQNIQGILQAVQVAGDGNGALNSAAVDAASRAVEQVVANNIPSSVARASNGAEARADISGNGIALSLGLPDAGSALQQLKNNGNIAQTIQIAADRQQVLNQLQLQLQLKPQAAASSASSSFSNALDLLRAR